MPVTPDPVRTQITAPSTNYVPEAAPNKTEENRQLNLGVNAIGKMFGDLANREKQRQVASDIMVAENAAIRGELLPGTLLPVAVDAYNKAVDNIAANEMLVEHEIKRSSKDYVSVIDDPSITTDVKNKAVDDQRALTFARAAQYITDPDVLLSLNNKLTTGVLVDKKLVIEAEANQRNLVMIKQIQNKIKNNDSIKNETIDEAGNVVSTSSEFNAKWINETAAELGEYNAYVPEHLRKLLAFKVLAKSSDAVENPNIIHKLLLEEYSPGFTYGNLLLATGDDAEEHLKTYTTFLTESAAYAESTRKAETARVKKERIDLMNSLSAKGDVKSVLGSSLTISDKNTVLTAIKKYDSNQPQIEIDSDTFLSYKEKIITGGLKLTKATLEHHGHIANFSTEAVALLQQYLTEEGEQLVRNENALIDSVKTLDQNLVSLGKTELFQDGKLLAIIKKAGLTGWTQELRERLQNKTVPAALQAALIEQINDFRRDMAVVRGKVAQRAANQNNQSGSLSEKAIEAYSKQWNERFRNVAEGIDEKHFLKMNQDTKNKKEAELRLHKALSLKEQKKADEEAAKKLQKEKNENKKGFVDQILEKIGEVVIDMISPEEADAAQDSNFNPDTPKSGGFTGPDSKEIAVKSSETIENISKAQETLVGDTTLPDVKANSIVNFTKEVGKKYKHSQESLDNLKKLTGADVIKTGMNGVQSVSNMKRESVSFAKEVFNDSTLENLWVGYKKGKQISGVKQINDTRRLDGNKNSSHKHGSGIDLSASWTGSNGSTYEIRDKANRKTINLFKASLTNKGWTVVKKDGKEIVEKAISGKGKNQYWMKFSKGKDIRYVEVVSNPRHIHLHTGEGFAGGWK